MGRKYLLCFASLLIFSTLAHSAIIYNFESLVTYGIESGSSITGTVVIDDAAAQANTYLSVDTPATVGISGAITSWHFDTPYGDFDSFTSSTLTHNAYYLDSISSPSIIMLEWYVEIQLDFFPARMLLGTDYFGGTSVLLYGLSNELSSGVGEFTLAAVPIPAAVWLFGSGLFGLLGVARRKSYA